MFTQRKIFIFILLASAFWFSVFFLAFFVGCGHIHFLLLSHVWISVFANKICNKIKYLFFPFKQSNRACGKTSNNIICDFCCLDDVVLYFNVICNNIFCESTDVCVRCTLYLDFSEKILFNHNGNITQIILEWSIWKTI